MEPGCFSRRALRGNVARIYDETVERHADRVALVTEAQSFTHAELRERASRFAGGLDELGVEPDDRLVLFLPNCPEFVIAVLGGFLAGTSPVPLSHQFTAREIAFHLDDADAAVLLTHADLRERALDGVAAASVDPVLVTVGGEQERESLELPFESVDAASHRVERADDDVALQPYTSGTTGEPKGVHLTHRNVRAQSLLGFERTNLLPERERFLSVMPLAHVAGLINRTWQPLVRGATVHLRDPREWDPGEVLATIEREKITKFGAVTTMYVDLVNHEAFGACDLSSLSEAMVGADAMPADVQRRFEEGVGVELFEAYGLTETGGGTHAGINSTFGPRPGTIGQPLRATDCKVVDEEAREVGAGESGELLVRGPHVMAGYHDRAEATAEAFAEGGYLRTGDVVRRDEDNYYEVLDRKSDVIVTAGYTVYPCEVEEVLHEHPGVVDAAVVGTPDERRGETVEAYVIPDRSADLDADELREHCLERLAAYKHPRRIEFVDRLPRTASGKVRRFELRAESD